MIVWVARAAAAASRVDRVLVATDDTRIADVVRDAGFEAVMTDPAVPSGSDRVAAAVDSLDVQPSLIVNVQGDEPLLDPVDLDALIEATGDDAIGTLARPLVDPDRIADPNVVKVVRAESGRALYFSRAPIPHGASSYLQHVGLYAYPPAVLKRFVSLAPSPLEKSERLEQLRAMEHGIPIHVTLCLSSRPSIGVDTPADLERVEAVLRQSKPSVSGKGHAPQAAS